ncbi:hypothetical protein C8J57DRAFT_1245492 [Mycena rebaudengoi]|nr:hypothetical protein C8J57DRAFT_1245492 [Mycena rebaudengoi]
MGRSGGGAQGDREEGSGGGRMKKGRMERRREREKGRTTESRGEKERMGGMRGMREEKGGRAHHKDAARRSVASAGGYAVPARIRHEREARCPSDDGKLARTHAEIAMAQLFCGRGWEGTKCSGGGVEQRAAGSIQWPEIKKTSGVWRFRILVRGLFCEWCLMAEGGARTAFAQSVAPKLGKGLACLGAWTVAAEIYREGAGLLSTNGLGRGGRAGNDGGG